jgi:hypothetical protein
MIRHSPSREVSLIVCLLSFIFAQTDSRCQTSDEVIKVLWGAFVHGQSVKVTKEKLGPPLFEGKTTSGILMLEYGSPITPIENTISGFRLFFKDDKLFDVKLSWTLGEKKK